MTRLLDPTAHPVDVAFRAAAAPAFDLWDACREVAEDRMGGVAFARWEGPRHGWALRVERAGRVFLTLEPLDSGFRALVVLGPSAALAAEELPLGSRARGVLAAAPAFPEGKWLYLPIEDAADVADVAALLALKLPPTVRRRVEAALAR